MPTLRGIVRQTAYSGERTIKPASGETIQQATPAIVESDTQRRALARLEENRRYSGGRPHRNYLLRGLVECEVCGCSCVGRNHPRHGKPYYYYRCGDDHPARGRRAPRGHAPYVQAPWLEETVWSDVRQFLHNPGAVLERIKEQRESGSEQAELEERRASLKKRLCEVEAELDRLVTLYASGQINAERLSGHVRDRESKIENLKLLLEGVEDDLAAVHESRAQADSAAAWLVTLASRVEEVEADTEEALEKRRELIRLLVETCTVGRDENGQSADHLPLRATRTRRRG